MIKKPNEIANNTTRIRMLIAGFPGIGKTTLALSAPNPLLIDADFGVTRVKAMHRKDTIQPESYQSLLDDLTPENLKDYKTIVIDTGGALFELMKPYIIKDNPKNGKKDGNLSLQGYGAAGAEFKRLMDMIYYQLQKNIIVTFHAKENKDDESTRLRILIEGSTKDNVWQPMDLGGFMEMQNNIRTIGFSNCERYFAKGTYGISGIWNIPELNSSMSNDFLTRLFDIAQENIRNDNEIFTKQQAEYEALMKSFDFENTDINELLKQIMSTKHILTSKEELKTKLKAKAKKEGWKFDKEAKIYVLDNGESSECVAEVTQSEQPERVKRGAKGVSKDAEQTANPNK